MAGGAAHRAAPLAPSLIIINNCHAQGQAALFPEAPPFVTDRAGHDRRYPTDETKARAELDYAPEQGFETGLSQTLRWYLDHEHWWRPLVGGKAADK